MKLLVLVAMLLTTTSLRAADGDVFTAQTAEGVTMTFKVISESLKTCQVGGNYGTGTAIPNDTQGRVTIPQKAKNYKVTTITYSAFNNCKYLEEIIIPEGVTTIESNAFMSCKKLGNVTFPESLTKIGHQTFGFCSNITSVFIPKNVTEIGNGGYDMGSSYTGCEKLTTITVSSENPIFDSRDNCNAIVETASNKLITGCGSTIIPNSISTIG